MKLSCLALSPTENEKYVKCLILCYFNCDHGCAQIESTNDTTHMIIQYLFSLVGKLH